MTNELEQKVGDAIIKVWVSKIYENPKELATDSAKAAIQVCRENATIKTDNTQAILNIQQQNRELREALKRIACQNKESEMDEDQLDECCYKTGYECCIDEAREALKKGDE
jgi:hypothetical protein